MDTLIIKQLYRRLKGYTQVQRQNFILLKIGFNDRQFILYRLINECIVDWDKRHEDMYGTFILDYEKLAFILNWSESKVRKIFNELYIYGFYKIIDKTRVLYAVVCYEKQEAYRKKKHDSENNIFTYTENLLNDISNNNNKASILLDNLQKLKRNFPYLEKKEAIETATKGNNASIYSDNISSSNAESSFKSMNENVDPDDIPF